LLIYNALTRWKLNRKNILEIMWMRLPVHFRLTVSNTTQADTTKFRTVVDRNNIMSVYRDNNNNITLAVSIKHITIIAVCDSFAGYMY